MSWHRGGTGTGRQYSTPDGTGIKRACCALINPGDGEIAVRVSGTDDAGLPGSKCRDPHAAAPVCPYRSRRRNWSRQSTGSTARPAPESRAGLDGELGEGTGKWQLLITADDPIVVMSLLLSPDGPSDESLHRRRIGLPLVRARSGTCRKTPPRGKPSVNR